jgi:predicted transcriptional regulator
LILLAFLFPYPSSWEGWANGKNLITDQSRRAVAVWESALKELLDNNLLVERGHSGEIFEVTKKGYDVAEQLPI